MNGAQASRPRWPWSISPGSDLILLLVGCLGLAACGAASASRTTPTPTQGSLLAARYTELVRPPNDAGDRLHAASQDRAATVESLRQAAQGFLDSLIKLNQDLVAFQEQVPEADKTDVSALRETLSKDEADVRVMIGATSVSQFDSAYAKLTSDDNGQAATAVRSDLGLDPGNP